MCKLYIGALSLSLVLIPSLLAAESADTAGVRIYDDTLNYADVASALTVDDLGNTFITGCSWQTAFVMTAVG